MTTPDPTVESDETRLARIRRSAEVAMAGTDPKYRQTREDLFFVADVLWLADRAAAVAAEGTIAPTEDASPRTDVILEALREHWSADTYPVAADERRTSIGMLQVNWQCGACCQLLDVDPFSPTAKADALAAYELHIADVIRSVVCPPAQEKTDVC